MAFPARSRFLACAVLLLLALASPAWAALSPAQLATLKADILANSDLNSQPNTPDGNFEIARLYNLPASPNFTVWKTQVTINAVGSAFNATELAGLTTGNQTRLQTIAQYLATGVNPSRPDTRAFFDDVFSGAGGTNTRAALLVLWKRLATRAEKLYATGTGSDPSPATLTFEGSVSPTDVVNARNLP